MRRLLCNLVAFIGLVVLMTCSRVIPTPLPLPGVIVLFAQSVPASVVAFWTPSPAAENVIGYTVALDGSPAVSVPTSVCASAPVECRFAVSIPTIGPHVVTVQAVNLSMSGDPGVVGSPQSGPGAIIHFTLNLRATAVTGTGVR